MHTALHVDTTGFKRVPMSAKAAFTGNTWCTKTELFVEYENHYGKERFDSLISFLQEESSNMFRLPQEIVIECLEYGKVGQEKAKLLLSFLDDYRVYSKAKILKTFYVLDSGPINDLFTIHKRAVETIGRLEVESEDCTVKLPLSYYDYAWVPATRDCLVFIIQECQRLQWLLTGGNKDIDKKDISIHRISFEEYLRYFYGGHNG